MYFLQFNLTTPTPMPLCLSVAHRQHFSFHFAEHLYNFFYVLVVNYFFCIEFLFIVSPFFSIAIRISHLLGIKFPVLARLLLCGFLLVGNDLN